MKLVLGADPFGVEIKEAIKKHLLEKGIEVIDLADSMGPEIPYYDVAATGARMIQEGKADRGIFCCGTGMGVAIVANKFRGIYASVVESEFAAQHCRAINDSNVLTMGGMIIAPYLAVRIADRWLGTLFTEGLPQFKDFLSESLQKIQEIEKKTMQ